MLCLRHDTRHGTCILHHLCLDDTRTMGWTVRCFVIDFGDGAIEAGRIVFPAVAAISAKEGPEIDHEHKRDNPISKKHGHLM